jgi:hypothetical protein
MKASWIPAILLGAACAAGAQTRPPADATSTRPGWELGLQASTYHYEEPGVMKVTGSRGGIVAAYTAVEDQLFTTLDARYSYGSLKYEGTGTQTSVPDSVFEARVLPGIDLRLGSSVSLSPYIGLGYRLLYDDLRGYDVVGGATYVGYRRYSEYIYAPIGMTLRLHLGSRWMLAPNVEYDAFISGKQKSRLTDTGIPGAVDVTNEQKDGRGYRGSLMFEKDHVAFGAWMHYWKIKDSQVDAATGIFEPANWTREAGVEFRYRF